MGSSISRATLTTNACESFHSHINSSFYTTHPNIFMFIEKLKEIRLEVCIKLNSINKPFKFQNSITKKKKKRENLENLINKHNSGQIPIEEYVSTICLLFVIFLFILLFKIIYIF
jgi:hypothetical protein